jgi:hypothetical protein
MQSRPHEPQCAGTPATVVSIALVVPTPIASHRALGRPVHERAWSAYTQFMVARAKSVRDRARANEQARILRVLAERIDATAAPLPAKVFGPLRDRVAENDELPPDEWEAVWTAEIEKRVADVNTGKVKRIPAKTVIEEALALARRSAR